jgi:hypothetical protein
MANASSSAKGSSPIAALASRQNRVARSSHGCAAIAGSWAATPWATAATIAVICSDETVGSARAQNGAQPAASASGSPWARRRRDVLEDLEGVQRGPRLAARAPQVGLEPPAVAAVGVAVRLECGERSVGRGAADDHVEPSAVQQAGVGGHEVGGSIEIDHAGIVTTTRRAVLHVPDLMAAR